MTTEHNGAWLKEWRARNYYSQQELADELDVSRQTLSSWEKSPKLGRVVYLALRALEELPLEKKWGALPRAIGTS
jgi:DNA-binding XRE family transcriptional regulator